MTKKDCCNNCWGTGKVPDFWDETKNIICPRCNGSGKEPQKTNEEWFDSLPTEEKAKKFVILCKNAFEAENYRTKRWKDYQNIDWWKEWLKQPHKRKEDEE